MIKLLAALLLISVSFGTSKEKIKDRIDSVLNKISSSTTIGILIYNPLMQDTIYRLNAERSMIPASNTKLFTTAAALSILGGDFLVKTKLLTDDFNPTNGTINGNLYLKGFGNPVFRDSDLVKMIEELKVLGIKKIKGNIIGDDSYFDDVYTRDDWIKDEVSNVKLPPISALVLNRNKTKVTRKSGRRIREFTVDVNDPPLFAAQKLREELINGGVEVTGNAAKGEAPETVQTLAEFNIQLRDLIKYVNKNSDNFYAECLFKIIGAENSGKQGNAFYSTQAILEFIRDNAIYSAGTVVVDGSGISRFNQITPAAIGGVLEKMYFDLAHFDDFYNSLSTAGTDGTLRRRLIGTEAENNLRGKTGTLNGVTSLSGYLTTKNNDDLIISMIIEFNRGGWNYYKKIEDEIIEALLDLEFEKP
jgi:D-alanyl-D-alanine carboxypeptidase/D-alanyl-D-alanine-endopeptidase (penicillin-binding protein 4)